MISHKNLGLLRQNHVDTVDISPNSLFVSQETVKVREDCHFAFRSVKFNAIN